jgi:hypothetical protein
MRYKKKHFIDFMQIELQDLREDLMYLKEENQRKLDQKIITERVFLENQSLYENELVGIDEFNLIMNNMSLDQFETMDAMIDYLEKAFSQHIRSEGLAPAVKLCIDRKLLKVKEYIEKEREDIF